MTRWIGAVICLTCMLVIGMSSFAAPTGDPPDTLLHGAEPARVAGDSSRSLLHDNDGGKGVQRATYQVPADPRAPANHAKAVPTDGSTRDGLESEKTAPHNGRHEMPPAPSAAPALISMLGSLAIVLGLFFGLIWFMRRGMPKGTRALPSEVVEVLGRAPLAARQQMHVVRFGPKLLLVSVTPGGAETLAEITDPAEVDRIAGICQQSQPNSATNAFRQVFRQFAGDRSARPGDRSAKSSVDASGRRMAVPNVMEDDDV